MSLESLSQQVDFFLTAAEERRYQIATGHRSPADLGRLFVDAASLFSTTRIAEVQRALAGAEGAEERRLRGSLEFLARGYATRAAAPALDRKLSWQRSGYVRVGEEAYPLPEISSTLRLATQTAERHRIAAAYLAELGDRDQLADEYLRRHQGGISELGYGSHLHAFQVLQGVDLQELIREGERFLSESEGLYFDLLDYHLPRAAGTSRSEAVPADFLRVLNGSEHEADFTTGSLRSLVSALAPAGVDPSAEGRISIEWGAPNERTVAAHRAVSIPRDLRISVAPAPGRVPAAALLYAHGAALHGAYTDVRLTVEERRLGDEAVPMGSGKLLESLLLSPAFMTRIYDLSRSKLADYQGLAVLCVLYGIRRDIALLSFEAAFHDGVAGGDEYVDLITTATGIQHDRRAALWEIEGTFASSSRLRALQLSAAHAALLRDRFDEDWFRNPATGGYLRDLFSNGRRYSAAELAVQLGWSKLGFDAVLTGLTSLVR